MWTRKHQWPDDGLQAEFRIVEENSSFCEYDQVSIQLIVSTPEFRETKKAHSQNWLWSQIGGNGSPKALLWARKQLLELIDLIGDQVIIKVMPSDYKRGHAYFQTLKKAGFEYEGNEFIRFPKQF